MSDELRKAAQDVIDRWHSPKWAHDSVHTGVLIDRLRAALATCPDCGKPAPEGSVHTCSPQKPDSDAVCEWTESDCFYESSCEKVAFSTDSDYAPPPEYMVHCYACGKRIRFIDIAMQQEQKP